MGGDEASILLFRGATPRPAGGPARADRLRGPAAAGERLEISGRSAYLHSPNGLGRSRRAARFDRKVGAPATARNWNTVVRLADLARAAAA